MRPQAHRQSSWASSSDLHHSLRRLQLGGDARTVFTREIYGQLDFVKRLDLVQELDDGHTGCINTLSWSSDGRHLLSGSDDTRLCFWGKGEVEGLVLDGLIETGHRANIFCARFAGDSSHGGGVGNDRVISCAGDHEIRVFDIERAAAAPPRSKMSKSRPGLAHQGLGAIGSRPSQIIRCHKDRVKRLAIDPTSPHVFLSCSEDATVRSHDLRHPHQCGPSMRSACPQPLVSYASSALDIYSLSVSRMQPYLFAIAGRDPYVYLHDRRMPELVGRTWHLSRSSHGQSACVRRFAPSTEPKSDTHVTAVKIGEGSGREMIASYSSDAVYLFDLYDDPEGQGRKSSDTFSQGKKKARMKAHGGPVSVPSVPVIEAEKSPATGDEDVEHRLKVEVGPEIQDDVFVDDVSEDESESLERQTLDTSASVRSEGEIDLALSPPTTGGRASTEPESIDESSEEEEEEEEEPPISRWLPKTKRRMAEPGVPIVTSYRQKYTGHANVQTVKDCNFFGPHDDYVVSGSDDGNFFVWDKKTAKVVNLLEGDSQVVNVIQGHPFEPMMAVSGIDSSVKIFEPVPTNQPFTASSSPTHSISPSPASGSSRQRLHQLDTIAVRNAESNRSDPSGHGTGISSRLLLGLLNRRLSMQRAATAGLGEGQGTENQVVISLQDLMQEAAEEEGEGQCATQ